MKRIILLAFAVGLFSVYLPAQQWHISGLENTGKVKLTRDRSFDGNSLWGYMNGGADLYLEYGFRALRVQEMLIDSQEVKVEMFLMEDPYAARALYSVLAGGIQGEQWNHPWQFNPYQAQMVFNDCYVSIINYSGSERGLQSCIEAGNLVKGRFSVLRLEIPEPISGTVSSWKCFKGPLGCRNFVPELEGVLQGMEPYEAWATKDLLEGEWIAHVTINESLAPRLRERLGGMKKFIWSLESALLKIRWDNTEEENKKEASW